MAGQAIFVIALLLIARFLWLRNQPERIMAGPGPTSKMFGDNAYTVVTPMHADEIASDRTMNVLQAQSIHDGKVRVIDREDTHWQFYKPSANGPSTFFSLAEGKLYYGFEQRPGPLKPPPEIVSSKAEKHTVVDPGLFVGNFLMPSKSPSNTEKLGQKRGPITETNPPIQDVRIRQVAVQGGTPQDVTTLHGTDACLIGNHVFWIRPKPEKTATVFQHQGAKHKTYYGELTANSDLMLTSLADGTTRCIRRGINRYTNMGEGESGVTWQEPTAFPGQPNVFYASASDGSVRSLGTIAGSGRYIPGISEFGSRLYLTDYRRENGRPSVLMSAKSDGTDIREVCAQRDKHAIENLELHLYKGGLYCCLTEAPTITKGNFVRYQYLCRLHPERSDPLEVLYKLPEKSTNPQFGEGYLYFVRNEQKRSLWGTLTSDDMGMESSSAFVRVPLIP